jgi:2,4-dienoyl-CoA reductase-like NADH-dependent reductase (Old Yellow Enzyme family)
MEPHELEALVEGFGQLAEIAANAGLDGVELHGGHGYLLHQSMSRWANTRQDE